MNDHENTTLLKAIVDDPLAAVADYYAGCLVDSPKAIAFIQRELKLTIDDATAQGVGFSDRTLGKRLPSKQVKAGREIRERLQTLGLYKANGRETLRGYVTVPIRDEAGRVIGIRGYKVDRKAAGSDTLVIGREEPMGEASEREQRTAEVTENAEESTATFSASPAAPSDDLQITQSEVEVTIRIESRRWRIRGLERNTMLGVMKVNVMVFNERNDRFHVDTLDLYYARSRRVFLKEAEEETALAQHELRSDAGRVLLSLEQLQHERRSSGTAEAKPVELTDAERDEAMELLTDEILLDRILDDFDACGIVGERIGKLTGYLVATSRLLPKPLGMVIQSSSAAGKTSLLDAILAFMPSEQQFGCSAMTSKSLYYAGNLDLRHKILSIAEEEGVRDASYALKLLQSEGKLSIVTTAKESGSGRTTVERHDVHGPVATLMTSDQRGSDQRGHERSKGSGLFDE